jgi:hypothetical protein
VLFGLDDARRKATGGQSAAVKGNAQIWYYPGGGREPTQGRNRLSPSSSATGRTMLHSRSNGFAVWRTALPWGRSRRRYPSRR